MRLPVEVLEAVIDQASDNPMTLRHLSLTCATLLPRSRLHLFRNIVIKTEEQLWSSSEFLDSHPWLVSLIQKVTLSGWPDEDVVHGRRLRRNGLLDIAPIHLLRRLPNLHVWHMRWTTTTSLSPHRSALLGYRQYGDHIRCLELYSTRFNRISDFKGLVSAFTRLDTLNCHWIAFKYEHSGDSPVTGGKKNKSLSISTLLISTAVDSQAMEYLLVNSGSKLKNLIFELSYLDQGYFERLEQSIILLTGLSSLVLVLCPDGPASSPTTCSDMLLFTAKILQQVHRRCLKDVQVEFITGSVAGLAIFLSRNTGAQCKDFETAILSFPNVPVLVRDPVRYRRAGRAKLWSPFICRAFPNLNQQGLLALKFTPSKESSPDPVGHETYVDSLVFSPDSAQVITASQDGTIIIWDMASRTVLLEWIAHDRGSVHGGLALSPDGRRLVSLGIYTLAVWDIDGSKSAQKVAELEGHTDVVRACAWSPDARLIASGSEDGTVRIWDGETYQQRDLLDLPSGHKLTPWFMKFSPNGRYLAWMSNFRENCWVWTPLAKEPPKMLRSNPNPSPDVHFTAFAFDHESLYIATAYGLNSDKPDPDPDACVVRIWDAATGAPLKVLTGHSKEVSNVCFTSDGRSLLSVSRDMDVRVWDCGTWSGEQVGVFEETDRESPVSRWTTCFRHDGRYMATQSLTGTVQVWRMGDGSCIETFRTKHDSDSDVICHTAFSPNGQFLVSGDNSGIVRICCISKYMDE